jgi:uncharacterized protein (TIGR02680 family)
MTPPAATRLKPVRAGIVGLWDYTEATFAFADGRLVLRGANGSGKTKALEVLFPFVLDGRLDPRRLDPFSGENRTMKENLLWRGTDSAYGYAWLEFAVPATPDAPARHVTIGVGMRAQRHRPSPTSWFFVAHGRVGEDVPLVVDGRPLTRRELADRLGDEAVVDRASDHRRRVDAALFGLGAERYEAMLDLVLTLRRPMLAKDLDPQLLSETLTRGLRPLDDDLLEQVARSFDDLEAVQRDLDQLAAADDATQRFLTDYRGYLRTQARHRADATIEAVAARGAAVERQQAAHGSLDEARAAEAMAEAETTRLEDQLDRDRARRDALRASEAFRTAGQLDHLERSVRDLAEEVARAERRRSDAEAAAEREGEQLDDQRQRRARVVSDLDRLRPRLAAAAGEAGIGWQADDAVGDDGEVRQRVGARAAARRSDLEAVRAALAAAQDAERRLVAAEAAVERATDADEAAEAALATAEEGVRGARHDLEVALGAWADAHTAVVSDEDRAAVLTSVATAGEDDQPAPADLWRERLAARRDAAATERARVEDALAALASQRDALEERRQAILDERDDAPPAVDWRGGGREERAGAPLWRLVRFADGVDDAAAAGIEAALEAAGLLDAWVGPDGGVAEVLDAFLVPDAEDGTPQDDDAGSGGRLADLLVPEEQDHVPTEVVARLLRSIALSPDDGEVAIGADGRYRLGPLAGRHQVAAPRYLGATARAAHRAARVAALDGELAELARETDQRHARLAELEAWLTAADAATAALPPIGELRRRLRELERATGRRQEARGALHASRAAAETARRELNERRDALRREAERHALPIDPDAIAAVAAAVTRFETDGQELATTIRRLAERTEAVRTAEERVTAATTALDSATTEVTTRRRAHDSRATELTTLRDRMGADVAAVMAELEEVEQALTADERARVAAAQQARDAAAARGQAEGEVGAAAEAVTTATEHLTAAEERLAVLTRPDLAGPLELTTPPDASADALLDAVDQLVTGVSGTDERRKAAQTRITHGLEELQHALGSGYHPAWDVEDDVIVVTVGDDLGVRSMAAFAQQLAVQRGEQEALLTARERALFEDTLLTSVCGQIHHRIQATRDLVSTMDREMRARRLSSGQTVGVAWRAQDTATDEWKRVHRLLDQDPAHFGPDQLDELRRHFSAEIKAARAADPKAPYRELLGHVLDYRTWRRFELSLIEADGSASPLTRARHARLSGGEKAASLHLPLFAAAHAAFAGARHDCPRLLGLDEAFAGIDDQGRSELLSLSVTFDLDLFMTGYDLWAVDPAVPAVAHYDLLHLADEHAVSSLLIVWDGAELLEGPDAEVALAAANAP